MSSMQTAIRYVTEVTPGTTPTDDAGWKDLPIVSEGLNIAPTVGADDSIIPDGMERDAPLTDMSYGGGINANLIAGYYDDFMAGAFGGAWATDVLKMGALLPTFSIEREWKYLTSGNNFAVHQGMGVNSMTIGFTYPGNITIAFEFLGLTCTFGTASLVGLGSTAAVGEYSIMTAANGVTNVLVDGSALPADGVVTAYNFTVARNLSEIKGAGAPIGPKQPPRMGPFQVTGAIELYHSEASQEYYERVQSGALFDLDITLTDGTASYQIDTPKLRLTGGGDPNATGQGSENMVNLPFRGLYDTDTVATITRVP